MLSFFFKFIPTKDVLKEVLTLSTAAFGLIAALAWNDAIQAIVNKYLSADNGGVVSKLIYALIVTVLAVLVTTNLSKIKDRFDEEKEKAKD